MPLIVVDEETGQWVHIRSDPGVFFLGGVESDAVICFDLRGWQEYDVAIFRDGVDWRYRDRLLQDGDVLQEQGTSRLLVRRVSIDAGSGSALACDEESAGDACRRLCIALSPYSESWPCDPATVARLTKALAQGDPEGELRRRLREQCESAIRSAHHVVPRAFAVSVLAKLANHDPQSVDRLAALFGDGTLHPAAFGAIAAAESFSLARAVLHRLSEVGSPMASTLQSTPAGFFIAR